MNTSRNTQQFLRYLSRRLSGREDCKKVEFIVGIGFKLDDEGKICPPGVLDPSYISFCPKVDVYRDKHHRKEIDLNNIVDHIVKKYYSDLILGYDLMGKTLIDTSKFLKGVYQYQLSIDGKRRRWVRRNEFVTDSRKSRSFYITTRRDD